MKTILITGATGFIGKRVIRIAALRGLSVIACSRSPVFESVDGIKNVAIDLSDHIQVRDIVMQYKPDIILHLAWFTEPRTYLDHPANIGCISDSISLMQSALSAGCREIIMAGTCAEYRPIDRDLREDDPLEPQTLYAGCKVATWAGCTDLARKEGARFVWGRIFGLYGPDEKVGRLLPDLRTALLTGNMFEASDGSQIRDLLHVDDAATAFISLIESELNGPVNICSGKSIRLSDIMLSEARKIGREDLLRLGAKKRRPWDPDRISGDVTRLLSLGWVPTVDILK